MPPSLFVLITAYLVYSLVRRASAQLKPIAVRQTAIVVQSVAAGDSWYVPAEALDDGMNETDIEEGREIAGLTGFQKMALTNEKKERFLCAFTSQETMTAHQEGTWISVGCVARAMLRDLLPADEFMGLVLNPWTAVCICTISTTAASRLKSSREKSTDECANTQFSLKIDAFVDSCPVILILQRDKCESFFHTSFFISPPDQGGDPPFPGAGRFVLC